VNLVDYYIVRRGGDSSMFIGLTVAGIPYYLLAKSIDAEGETKIAEAEAKELEKAAMGHQLPEGATDSVTRCARRRMAR